MSQLIKLFAVVVAGAWFGVTTINAQIQSNSSTDEARIRQVVQQIQGGWNAQDSKAFAAPFAADADYVVVNGMKLKGREAIEKGHTGIFTTIYKDRLISIAKAVIVIEV